VGEPDRDGKPPGGDEPGRCLLVANVFPPVVGGSASVYDSLARFSGGRVTVLAPQIDYLTGRVLEGAAAFDAAAPFPVHRLRLLRTRMLPQLRSRDRLWLAFQDILLRARLVWAVARITRAEAIGTVCIGELVACGWLVGVCRRLGLRTVIYVHGEEVSITDAYDFAGTRRRAALSQADAVVAVSRFAREAVAQLMGQESGKVVLIPNGVDLARFSPRPRRADLVARYGLAGRRVLLTVGRLSERKGMDRVIQALPRLRAEMPDLVYLMVGEGLFRASLEALAASLGVSHAVIFAGSVSPEELVDHYALADAFIMANRTLENGDTEGFGLVFLEANACAVPVIAGCAGGSVDAVTDGVNGLVVDGTSCEPIEAGVRRLLGDSRLREALVQEGLAVAARSGWSERVAAFLRVCDGAPL
jgi:phosphatidylinositol alpha-1,6-mannosyltransferase